MGDLKLYESLSRLPWPRTYVGKVVVVAQVGLLLPLATSVGMVAAEADPTVLLAGIAVSTIVGAYMVRALLRRLMAPIELTAEALRGYLERRAPPELPHRFGDTAGHLMRDTAYALGRLDERLRELDVVATTDPLTGVYNRRAGDLALTESLARCHRGLAPFQMLLLDVDGLRHCNERYGYAVGDRYLIRMVELMRSTLRGTDWIARWANDDFVVGVVAPPDEAESVAQRLAQSLHDLEIELDNGEKVPLSVSAGLVTASAGDTALGLHRRAGEALFRAKAGGGGRIAVWSPGARSVGVRLVAGCFALLVLLAGTPGDAAQSVAVFPFALVNTSLQADQPAEVARMERMTAAAGEQLAGRGFTIVDIGPAAKEIEATGSIHECNGCELDIARELGAEVAAVGWVQKVSNLILNLSMQLREVESGRLIHAASVDLRGNTDESWQRSVTYLIENRLFKTRN